MPYSSAAAATLHLLPPLILLLLPVVRPTTKHHQVANAPQTHWQHGCQHYHARRTRDAPPPPAAYSAHIFELRYDCARARRRRGRCAIRSGPAAPRRRRRAAGAEGPAARELAWMAKARMRVRMMTRSCLTSSGTPRPGGGERRGEKRGQPSAARAARRPFARRGSVRRCAPTDTPCAFRIPWGGHERR